jgi:hypothetical protein
MMRNGIAYQLPPLAHLTDATEYGLLPTPTASDATVGEIIGKNDTFKVTKSGSIRKYTKNGIGGSLGLARYVKFWPTPCARDWKDTAISLEMLAREGKSFSRHKLACCVALEELHGGALSQQFLDCKITA